MNKKILEEKKELLLQLMGEELYVPMKEKELACILQVSQEERPELKLVLEALLAENKIQMTRRGKFLLSDEKAMIGTFISNQRGFGFVEIEGQAEDYYIPETSVNGAFHLDRVEVKLLPGQKGKRQEAEIVSIRERGTTRAVGTFEKAEGKGFGFVVPDSVKLTSDIFIPVERSKGAVDGHKVVVEFTDYGDGSHKPEGKIVEILGHVNDPGVDIMAIIKGFDLPVEFPERVMNQAARIPEAPLESDLEGRLDLRDTVMVTIDGEDARDLDDAVSLTVEGDRYHLGVHIADVANYVQEGSALDREALVRGTSVYLVDRVIPMLPHKLSNGICSLNAGVDRLALSCMMVIDRNGDVVDYQIAETVIRVNRRMTYTAVRQILGDCDDTIRQEYGDLVPMLEKMGELADILRRKRKKRGSIDFDFPETKIILDKEGHPLEIRPYERNMATMLIEDFMLAANETVAQHFFWMELPFVYRTHDNPDPEKILKLETFIHNFGYYLKASREEIHPKEFQKLLSRVEGTPEEALISRLTLRSMKQARYTTEGTGHFGLACQYYCHFTSPIRRYPDLQIHRIIKEQLRGRLKENRIDHYEEILPEVASHSSKTERRADEAERETDKLKKVEFMEGKIGETFEGVISGITGWGIFVELTNTVEGMIHVSKLPGDYYCYDEKACEMVGQSTGRRFRLGEVIRVVAEDTDRMTRSIDFVMAEDEEEACSQKGGAYGKRSNEAGSKQ